jgi:drug/metabolite transporter (DMT)-like permease
LNPERAANSDRWALIALIAGAVAIAFSPIFVRFSELGPVTTAFYRVGLAIPPLLLVTLWRKDGNPAALQSRPTSLADIWQLSIAGLFFAGDLALWHWSIALTSVANATLLANAAPIFVTLGSWLLFGKRFKRGFLLALALAMVGLLLLLGESALRSQRVLLGDALGLMTAMFYGAYILSVEHLRRRFTTACIMGWSALAAASGWLILLGLAWFSHAGGQSLIAYALAHLPAAFSSVALLVQPVTAALLAWLLLGESLSSIQTLGGVVVLVGIYLARRGSRDN